MSVPLRGVITAVTVGFGLALATSPAEAVVTNPRIHEARQTPPVTTSNDPAASEPAAAPHNGAPDETHSVTQSDDGAESDASGHEGPAAAQSTAADSAAKPASGSGPGSTPVSVSAPKDDSASHPKQDAPSTPQTGASSEPGPNAESAPKSYPDSTPKSALSSAPKSDTDSAPKSDTGSGPKEGTGSMPKADVGSGATSDDVYADNSDDASDTKADPSSGAQGDNGNSAKADANGAVKADAATAAKATVDSASASATKGDSGTTSKAADSGSAAAKGQSGSVAKQESAAHGAAVQSAATRQEFELHQVQAAVQKKRAALVSHWQGKADQAVQFAYHQRGKPYVWGGTGQGGFDCSGLVQTSWHRAGVSIPRVAADQYHRIRTHVSTGQLRPGDLVYFHHLGHVGMYLGKGRFIHSPHTGSHVQVEELNSYWRNNLVGAARPAWPKLPAVPTRLV